MISAEKRLMLGCFLIVLGIGVFAYSSIDDKNTVRDYYLTQSQIDSLVQMGAIQVNTNINHEITSQDTGLVYKTEYGECPLYKDIFGRYYCRW